MNQHQHFSQAHRKIADANETMLDLLYGPNPITDAELLKAYERRPHVYGRFLGYIGKRDQ